ALKQTRSSIRGRPPRGSGTCSGSKGPTASHSSSRTRHTEEAATRHLPSRGYVTQPRFAAERPQPPRHGFETGTKRPSGGRSARTASNFAATGARISVVGVDEWTFRGDLMCHYASYYDS